MLVACHMYDLMGVSVADPDEAQIRGILRQLEHADDEHPDVWLEHELDWSLVIFSRGRVLWHQIDGEESEQWVTMESEDEIVELLRSGPW